MILKIERNPFLIIGPIDLKGQPRSYNFILYQLKVKDCYVYNLYII